uniref:Uncharacterized protein n=1 Tax=Panagrolaimus sp. JU765 TaxID=591449 RepID=A0AC34QI62_9BILA
MSNSGVSEIKPARLLSWKLFRKECLPKAAQKIKEWERSNSEFAVLTKVFEEVHVACLDIRRKAERIKFQRNCLVEYLVEICKIAGQTRLERFYSKKITFLIQSLEQKLRFIFSNVGNIYASITVENGQKVCFHHGFKYSFDQVNMFGQLKWKCMSSKRHGCRPLFTNGAGRVLFDKIPAHFHSAEYLRKGEFLMPKVPRFELPNWENKPIDDARVWEDLLDAAECLKSEVENLLADYDAVVATKLDMDKFLRNQYVTLLRSNIAGPKKLFLMSFVDELRCICGMIDFDEIN